MKKQPKNDIIHKRLGEEGGIILKETKIRNTEYYKILKKMLAIIIVMDVVTILIFFIVKGVDIYTPIGVFISSGCGYLNFIAMIRAIFKSIKKDNDKAKRQVSSNMFFRLFIMFFVIGIFVYLKVFPILALTIPILYATAAFFIALKLNEKEKNMKEG